jgi:hypothetical protein
LLFQAVFAIYILVVTPFLPDTPRWLLFHESSPDRGTLVLSKLRNKSVDDAGVLKERDDILAAINIEANEEGGWKALISDGGCAANKRFFLALGIQFMQQTSGTVCFPRYLTTSSLIDFGAGINIVTYYAPTLFEQNLGFSQVR